MRLLLYSWLIGLALRLGHLHNALKAQVLSGEWYWPLAFIAWGITRGLLLCAVRFCEWLDHPSQSPDQAA